MSHSNCRQGRQSWTKKIKKCWNSSQKSWYQLPRFFWPRRARESNLQPCWKRKHRPFSDGGLRPFSNSKPDNRIYHNANDKVLPSACITFSIASTNFIFSRWSVLHKSVPLKLPIAVTVKSLKTQSHKKRRNPKVSRLKIDVVRYPAVAINLAHTPTSASCLTCCKAIHQ